MQVPSGTEHVLHSMGELTGKAIQYTLRRFTVYTAVPVRHQLADGRDGELSMSEDIIITRKSPGWNLKTSTHFPPDSALFHPNTARESTE